MDLTNLTRCAMRVIAMLSPLIVVVFSPTPLIAQQTRADDAVVQKLERLGGRFLVVGERPSWSPDGRRIVFGKYPFGAGLRVLDLETSKVTDLVAAGKDPDWQKGEGRLIAYVRGHGSEEEIWAVQPDGQHDRKLADGGFPTWSVQEKRLFFHSRKLGKLMVFDLGQGNPGPAEVTVLRNSWYPAVSPDGTRVAYLAGAYLQVLALPGKRTLARAEFPGWRGGLPGWCPDGKLVGVGSYASGDGRGLWVLDVPTGRFDMVIPGCCTMPAWSPDATRLAFEVRSGRQKGDGIWLIESRALNDRLAWLARAEPGTAARLSAEQERRLRDADRLSATAVELWKAGKYREALPVAEQVQAMRLAVVGESHPEHARSLSLVGMVHEALGEYAQAETSYRQSLEIRRRVLGVNHADYATSLHDLGALYRQIEEYAKAKPLLEAAVDARKRLKGENHPDYAASLFQRAWLHERQEENAEAERLYQRARQILERSGNQNQPLYAHILRGLGRMYARQGEHARAQELLQQSLDLQRRLSGESHPDYAAGLNALAWMHRLKGEYARAKQLCLEAIDLRKRALGEKHPVYGRTLEDLAAIYESMGERAKAEVTLRQSLETQEQILGEKSLAYAAALDKLAWLYEASGKYVEAESVFKQVLAIRLRKQGLNHPDRATTLIGLGIVRMDMGNFGAASNCFDQAVRIRKQTLGESHLDYARALQQLAWAYLRWGQFGLAEGLGKQVLAIRGRVQGTQHWEYAHSLNDLGVLYSCMGRPADAERLLLQALEIYKRTGVESGFPYAYCVGNLGGLYAARGDFVKAQSSYREAVEVRKRLVGETDPRYAFGLEELGRLCEWVGEYREAEALVRKALRVRLDYTRSTLQWLPESRAQIAITSAEFAPRFDALLSVLGKRSGADASEAYAAVWETRALVTQVLTERREDLADSPQARALGQQLQATCEQLAQLTFTDTEPQQRDVHWNRLAGLSGQKERLEAQLAALSADVRGTRQGCQARLADLAARLDPQTAVVEMVKAYLWERVEPGRGPSGTLRYQAFVLRRRASPPGLAVAWIDLGKAGPIDDAVERWRQAIANKPLTGEPRPEMVLRRSIWDKLEPHLAGCSAVIVIPDGTLSFVPWCALPGKKPATRLLEDYAIATASYGQQLYALLTARPGRSQGALMVGGVAYDEQPSPARDSGLVAMGEVPRSRSPLMTTRLHWPPLPGTQVEIETLAAACDALPHAVLTGRSADELTLRRRMPGQRYIHLATHGFFADLPSAAAARSEPGPPLVVSFAAAKVRLFGASNPLILSGLVLAGANLPPRFDQLGLPSGQDGILTAEEIVGLDLRGTELVVLSACDTGLGKVAGGEGVMGLARAFHLAGARNVVASLWKVDDQATAALMKLFYHKLWQEKKSPIEALREAQLAIYRHPEQIGKLAASRGPDFAKLVPLADSAGKSAPAASPDTTRLWAAFVLSGPGN